MYVCSMYIPTPRELKSNMYILQYYWNGLQVLELNKSYIVAGESLKYCGH